MKKLFIITILLSLFVPIGLFGYDLQTYSGMACYNVKCYICGKNIIEYREIKHFDGDMMIVNPLPYCPGEISKRFPYNQSPSVCNDCYNKYISEWNDILKNINTWYNKKIEENKDIIKLNKDLDIKEQRIRLLKEKNIIEKQLKELGN
jgi:hypothetical protein